jgi:hypothetical protein
MVYEGNSNKSHVRGPMKAYRKECFLETGGLRETLGWDNIDSVLLESLGLERSGFTRIACEITQSKRKRLFCKAIRLLWQILLFLGLKRVLPTLQLLKKP